MKPRSANFSTQRRTDATALQIFEPDPNAAYSLAAVSTMLDVPRRTILHYCKNGLLTPISDPAKRGYYFDDSAIRSIRRIETLRHMLQDELTTIRMVLDLMNQVERLHAELRFLRG